MEIKIAGGTLSFEDVVLDGKYLILAAETKICANGNGDGIKIGDKFLIDEFKLEEGQVRGFLEAKEKFSRHCEPWKRPKMLHEEEALKKII